MYPHLVSLFSTISEHLPRLNSLTAAKPSVKYQTESYGVLLISNLLEKSNGIVPNDRKFLESLDGVGRKTTNVVLSNIYNVPCIAIYTLFNEGWGQHDSDEYYKIVKDYDSTRLIDSTSGWFKANYSDFESLHIYFKKIKLNNILKNKPIIISEFFPQ